MRYRSRLTIFSLGMILATGRDLIAQELPPATNQNAQPFHFDPPETVLHLRTFYNSSTIKPADGAAKTENRDSSLQELLGLSTNGYIVNPEVADFSAAGTFGLEQRWEKLEGRHTSGNDTLYEYKVDFNLYPNSNAPLHLLANRSIDFTSQPFSETYRTTANNYEGSWDIRSQMFPTTLRIFKNDITQETISGVDDFTLNQQGAEWHTDMNYNPASHLSWNYNYNDVNQTNSAGQTYSYHTNAINLSHEYDFGSRLGNSFTSSFQYLNQQGDLAQEQLQIDESLNLHHSDRFETFYEYQFQSANYPEVDSTLNRIKAGFRSKPWDGLEATGTVGGLTLDLSGADTHEGFAQLYLDYSRPAPLGELTAFLHGDLDYQSNDAQSTESHVVARRAFGASQQIVLPYVGIKPDSITIRSASGPNIYFEGIDFTTTYRANRATITRIPDGNLPPDSMFIIDYDVNPKPSNDMDTGSANMGLRYDFHEGVLKGLGLYTRYFAQRQNIDSDQPGAFIEDNIDALTYGAEYRIWRLRFNAEHERHDSDLFPFHSDQFSARYEDRFWRDVSIAIAGTQIRTKYDDDGSHSVANTASGEVGYRFNRKLSATLSLNYLDLDDDITGGARGLDEELGIKWMYRDTTIKGIIRHSDLETDSQDSSFLFTMLSVERRF